MSRSPLDEVLARVALAIAVREPIDAVPSGPRNPRRRLPAHSAKPDGANRPASERTRDATRRDPAYATPVPINGPPPRRSTDRR